MQKRQSRELWSLLTAAIVATAVLCTVFEAFYWAPDQFVISRHSIQLKNWHTEHNGLKLAVISDIHLKNNAADIARLKTIVQAINAENPDLILLLGDFLGDVDDWQKRNASAPQISAILKSLKAKHGVFAVLGNHDWWLDGEGIRDALKSVGIQVMENELITVLIEKKPLNIIGLPDAGTRKDKMDFSKLPTTEIPSIVMAHDPDSFNDPALPYKHELTLCGHTHGGQVKLPLFGAVTAASDLLSPYTEGWYFQGVKKLFVTRGIGTSLVKIRYKCSPEVVILTVSKKE
ncbi:MAG: metallophosphoesterase [Lentisphaeria bacterium]|nr:metallophosphoesterase [Lentisphaeria bacterium]